MSDKQPIAKGDLIDLQNTVLDNIKYYQQEVARLTEENQRLKSENSRLRREFGHEASGFPEERGQLSQ